jgi:hypothetical protein
VVVDQYRLPTPESKGIRIAHDAVSSPLERLRVRPQALLEPHQLAVDTEARPVEGRAAQRGMAVAVDDPQVPTLTVGLCERCRCGRTVPGARSVFWRCERADTDPAYPRYPTLPVRTCPGFVPAEREREPLR